MAIKINTLPTTDNLCGKSHWWGAPDLPSNTPYPYVTIGEGTDDPYDEPLTFLCQICCNDIAPFDPHGLLPHTGMLWFFAPLDYFLGNLDAPLDHHTPPVVLYSPCTTGLSPYDIHWEGTDESIFRPAEAIVFSHADAESGDGILMLGKPYQQEIYEQHPHDVCLMQIDEDDRWGLRFYDCGMFYIFINPDSLRHIDFSNVQGDLFYY